MSMTHYEMMARVGRCLRRQRDQHGLHADELIQAVEDHVDELEAPEQEAEPKHDATLLERVAALEDRVGYNAQSASTQASRLRDDIQEIEEWVHRIETWADLVCNWIENPPMRRTPRLADIKDMKEREACTEPTEKS